MVHLAQVDAAGGHYPYLMEPGLVPRCETGGSSLQQGTSACSEPEPQHQLSCSAFVAPQALLTGLVGDCGVKDTPQCILGVVVKDKAGSWGAFCFQPTCL